MVLLTFGGFPVIDHRIDKNLPASTGRFRMRITWSPPQGNPQDFTYRVKVQKCFTDSIPDEIVANSEIITDTHVNFENSFELGYKYIVVIQSIKNLDFSIIIEELDKT